MKILVIVAHPDDEVIGLGGTLYKHYLNGDKIHILFLSDGRSSRNNVVDINEKNKKTYGQIKKVSNILNYTFTYLNFLDNQLDKYPLLTIVKECEKIIKQVNPDILYTHWIHDINIDHSIACRAALTAARPIKGNNKIQKIFEFETLSETEWTLNDSNFTPNTFSIINDLEIKKKQCALEIYSDEMKNFQHPRNIKIITLNSMVWGAKFGHEYVEPLLLIRSFV